MTSKVNSGFPLLTPSSLLRRFISEYLTLYEEKEKKKKHICGVEGIPLRFYNSGSFKDHQGEG